MKKQMKDFHRKFHSTCSQLKGVCPHAKLSICNANMHVWYMIQQGTQNYGSHVILCRVFASVLLVYACARAHKCVQGAILVPIEVLECRLERFQDHSLLFLSKCRKIGQKRGRKTISSSCSSLHFTLFTVYAIAL